jgi:hypothetical protein
MAINAALAGYCGFLVTDASTLMTPDEAIPIGSSPDLMSLCAAAVFVAVAAPCLIEARRCWKKASITILQARTGNPPNSRSGNLDSAGDAVGPHKDGMNECPTIIRPKDPGPRNHEPAPLNKMMVSR